MMRRDMRKQFLSNVRLLNYEFIVTDIPREVQKFLSQEPLKPLLVQQCWFFPWKLHVVQKVMQEILNLTEKMGSRYQKAPTYDSIQQYFKQ